MSDERDQLEADKNKLQAELSSTKTKLAETEPKHRYLSEYNLNQLESMLRVLEREEEAESIKKLNEKLNKD